MRCKEVKVVTTDLAEVYLRKERAFQSEHVAHDRYSSEGTELGCNDWVPRDY